MLRQNGDFWLKPFNSLNSNVSVNNRVNTVLYSLLVCKCLEMFMNVVATYNVELVAMLTINLEVNYESFPKVNVYIKVLIALGDPDHNMLLAVQDWKFACLFGWLVC